jgi:hypothetical protein
VENAINYIAARQKEDGSFEGDIVITILDDLI